MFESFWCLAQVRIFVDLRTNGSMRADKGTFAALDTKIRFPHRDFERHIAFFPLSGGSGEGAVDRHFADAHIVAITIDDLTEHLAHILWRFCRYRGFHGNGAGDLVGNVNLEHMLQGTIYSRKVLLNNRFAAFSIGLFDGLLDLINGLLPGEDTADCKETGLHDGIDTLTHIGLVSNFVSVDDVEL